MHSVRFLKVSKHIKNLLLIRKTSSAVKQIKKMSDFIFSSETPVGLLKCEESFSLLTEKEKLYSHYLSRACWLGGHIITLQTSIESALIYVLLHRLFSCQPVAEIKDIALKNCQFSEEELSAFLVYSCGICNSWGNFKGFGDSKFIPNLPKEKFEKLILSSKFALDHPEDVKGLLTSCLESIYSLNDNEKQLGFPHIGTTTFLSKNFTLEDNEIVTEFLKKKNLEAYNSRLFKTESENGQACYEIRLASVLNTDDEDEKELICNDVMNSHKFKVTRGDYSKILSLINKELEMAKKYAANENQENMISKYIKSFHTGSLDAHKDGSRFWIKDKGPTIESYIGFIETYKDPAGLRGTFEGFVAMVNKPMSKKFSELVQGAEGFLNLLPWPSCYEKDKFLQPDFTSLDILTFSTEDIPIGINIPNYDEIRQSEGFKNVTLGNAINVPCTYPPNFLSKEDQALFKEYRTCALELQTGLHELLGHGSGKLFKENDDGSLNFKQNEVVHLETNEKVTNWYKSGETYDSVFGSIGSPYEECKAECVGLYLSTVPEILRIFGCEGEKADNVLYVNWIDVVHAGIEALKMYEPKTESWLQAHGQAAYVILQVLLECGKNFVKIEKITGEDGKPDLLFSLDRSNIISVGKPCIGNFLKKLQVYKSTADAASARNMFEKYSVVKSEEKYPFLEYREIVLARRRPRKIFVQANTFIKDDKVELRTYPATFEGILQSWVERFQGDPVDEILEELWAKDVIHFT